MGDLNNTAVYLADMRVVAVSTEHLSVHHEDEESSGLFGVDGRVTLLGTKDRRYIRLEIGVPQEQLAEFKIGQHVNARIELSGR